jgi:hypothetical protein
MSISYVYDVYGCRDFSGGGVDSTFLAFHDYNMGFDKLTGESIAVTIIPIQYGGSF